MSEEHMVNALTWTPEFDLQARIDDVMDSFRDIGWDLFERPMFINVCKATLELDLHRTTPETLAKHLREAPEHLERCAAALRKAAVVLRAVADVQSPTLLPYSYHAVVLATCLMNRGKPGAKKRAQIAEWFWITTLTEHFRGMTSAQFQRSVAHFGDMLRGNAPPRPPDAAEVVDPFRRFDFRAARSRGLSLLLASLDPQDDHGELVDGFWLLAQHGTHAMPMLLPRRSVASRHVAMIEGPENRLLLPREDIDAVRLVLESDGDSVLALAASHAITPEALRALQSGDSARFLELRRRSLEELERAKAQALGLQYRTR